jgi:hypothetical protein
MDLMIWEAIMKQLKYEIRPDEAVTRWWVTDLQKEVFTSPCETFDAPVNLGEGYVQIVYPVRREFLKQNRIATVPNYNGAYDRVYFPFENNRVDFTTFIHTPHHFWINARTWLEVPRGGTYEFAVYTCGGVKIWVNGQEALCFAPYTRNIPGTYRVGLELQAGLNEVTVYADELAERDVFFYYELRYKGEEPLAGVLFVPEEPAGILAAETFLKSCFFEQDCVREGELILNYDGSLLEDDTQLTIEGDPESAKLNNIELEEVVSVVARRGGTQVSLGDIRKYNVGVFKILVGMQTGGFQLHRELVVGIIPRELTTFTPLPTLRERKRQALEFIDRYGENVVNRAMALLETQGELTPKALACLRNSMEMIGNKEDCADFYLVPLFLLITRYRRFLNAEIYHEIKVKILNFRFWIDEPGNDVMWYFSENHAFLFHISQYLAGHLFPDEVFDASGRRGSMQYVIGKKRVEDWFETFFRYGYAEWNSATYIPIDLIGFFVLYEMAPDDSLRLLAKRALDFTFRIMMYNSFNGIMSSSYGRAYEDTLKAREQVEPSFVEWVAYGTGYVNFRSRAVSLFCLSGYEPPEFHKETAVAPGRWMSVELDQGINKVKTYNFKTHDYFLACVRRFKPFVHGHQQHLMNVALGKKSVQYYLNHPGERPFSGGNRPCYWAGNGSIPFIEQYRNVMVMLFKIDPGELVHYIHAYCTLYAFDEYELRGNWFLIRVDDAYLGTYFSNGFSLTTSGANTGKEIISPGLKHGVIVKCGSKAEFGSFTEFKQALAAAEIEYDGDTQLEFADPQYGVVSVRGTRNFSVGGKPVAFEFRPEMIVLRGDLLSRCLPGMSRVGNGRTTAHR